MNARIPDEGPDRRETEDDEDLYAIFLRVTGWVYAAVGVAMLAFFFWWLRG